MDVGVSNSVESRTHAIRSQKTLSKNIARTKIFRTVSLISIILVSIFLFTLVFFVGQTGIKVFSVVPFNEYFFNTTWDPMGDSYGIASFITGSIVVTALTLVFCVPISLMIAITLVKWVPKKLQSSLRSLLDLLVGIPSVVYGFIGLTILVPFILENIEGSLFGQGVLASALVLTIMVMPTITRICEDAISAVDSRIEEASYALGATNIQTVFRTTIPAAKSGILTGIILGMTRALGETMAVVMVIGNIPNFIFSGENGFSLTQLLTTPTATITGNIVIEVMNVDYTSTWNHALYMMAFILLVMSLL
ncbi:MAG: phosphate ABC transporter permease subunit PstC, partial [Bacilli bacterium]